ncbi:MAG: class I SAM-dependent methyltransferase [Candidatus Paceibacterota bacterium]
MKNEIKIFYSKEWHGEGIGETGYELLDTGEGEKLERFGPHTFVRPYEEAFWKKTLPKKDWENISGKFWSSKGGAKAGWKMHAEGEALRKWEMSYKGIKFLASPTPFRHLGFFPEQAPCWDIIEAKIKQAIASKQKENSASGQGKPKFLNLFGYTGVASLFALRAGAEVTHLDASKQILKWAKENQDNAGLAGLPMRVIEDDVMKFLEREEKRGNKYDAIIMDPPKFGRGPKGEIWKLEENLPKLLAQARKVLSAKPLFIILTSYATDSSSLSTGYALEEMMRDFEGDVESGELCALEKSNGRTIPLSNTAIWSPK